jgi:hypothetical protein
MASDDAFMQWLVTLSQFTHCKKLMLLGAVYGLSKEFSYVSTRQLATFQEFQFGLNVYKKHDINNIFSTVAEFGGVVPVKVGTTIQGWKLNHPRLKHLIKMAADVYRSDCSFLDEVLKDE